MHLRPPIASAAVPAKEIPLDVANSLFIIAIIVCLDLFTYITCFYAVLSVFSRFAIISLRKRELIDLH